MKPRAKSTEEKREVIERLFELWEKFPELRLLQLIGNLYSNHELFYVEDFDLAVELETFYKQYEN